VMMDFVNIQGGHPSGKHAKKCGNLQVIREKSRKMEKVVENVFLAVVYYHM